MIARLSVSLNLETAAFDKGAKDAARSAKKTGDEMEAMGHRVGRMGKAFIAAGVAIAGSAVVSSLAGLVKQGLDHASALGEQAQQLGVTTKALQEYRYAATQAGLESSEMDQALSQLTKRMGEAAEGAKGPAEAFEKLGIDVKAFVDAGGDAGDMIPKIAEALKGVQSPAERAAVLVDLFGKAGQKLEPLLAEGAAGVNNLRDAANRLGIVLSNEQIQKADETADKLAALQQVLSAKISGAVADNAGAILDLANAFVTLVDKAGAAVNAYKRWRLEVGIRQQDNTIDGWFSGEAAKAQARQNKARMQFELNQINGRPTVISPGGRPAWPGAASNKMRPAASQPWGNTNSAAASPYLIGRMAVFSQITPQMMQALADQAQRTGQAFDDAASSVMNFNDAFEPLAKAGNKRTEEITEGEDILIARTREWKAATKEAAESSAASFEDSADRIIGALGRMGSAFRGGGFLDKLSAILGFGLQLGSVGAFGGRIANNIKASNARVPGFANGTNFAPGGLSLVGERGPELVNLRRGSQVIPNHMLGGKQIVEIVDTTGLFVTRVNGQIMQAAPAIAGSGSTGAQVAMAVKQSRRFP